MALIGNVELYRRLTGYACNLKRTNGSHRFFAADSVMFYKAKMK